jgi:hypothetical protein
MDKHSGTEIVIRSNLRYFLRPQTQTIVAADYELGYGSDIFPFSEWFCTLLHTSGAKLLHGSAGQHGTT